MNKLLLTSLIVFFMSLNGHGESNAKISGNISNYKAATIKVVLEVNFITRQNETFIIPVIDGQFSQEVSVARPTYVYVTDGFFSVNGIIEKGDNIKISCDAKNPLGSTIFDGKGKEKFLFLNTLIKYELRKKLNYQVYKAKKTKYPFDYLFNYVDSVGSIFSDTLKSIKSQLSTESFSLLSGDLMGTVMGSKFWSIGLVYNETLDQTLETRQNELTKKSKLLLENIFSVDNRIYSELFVSELYNDLYMYYAGLMYYNKVSKNILKKYNFLDSLLPPKLKIPILTMFLERDIDKLNQGEDIEVVISRTYVENKDSTYKNYIKKKYADVISFKKGMVAPDFSLENERGEKVTLATFRGKVVYLDFWYAACGPCHGLFNNIKSVKHYFSQNDSVVFLCVSIDKREVWQTSLKKFKIEGYHVFTENKEETHPVITDYRVGGYPTTCLIDANGKIFIATPSDNPDELTHQIKDALSSKPHQ